MLENPENQNQEIVPVNPGQIVNNVENQQNQPQKLVILNQKILDVNTSERIYDEQGRLKQVRQLSYEKSEMVAFFAGGYLQSKNNKEKAKISFNARTHVTETQNFIQMHNTSFISHMYLYFIFRSKSS